MNAQGWNVMVLENGAVTAIHTAGFLIAGFDSKDAAFLWLTRFVLSDAAQQRAEDRRADRERMEILAQMAPHGKVS